MIRIVKISVALVLGLVLGTATSFVTADALGGDSQAAAPDQPRRSLGRMTFSQIQSFDDFPLYGVGQQFAGLPLLHSKRISPQVLASAAQVTPPLETLGTPENAPESRGHRMVPDFVSMVYGSCRDAGVLCSTPLQIQVWRSCNRSLDDYELAPGVPYPHEDVTIRGVKAADLGDRLEVYAGSVTIVIFGDLEITRRAANALLPMNARASDEMGSQNGNLPPSNPGPECA